MTLFELTVLVWRRRWTVAGTTVIAVAASVAIALLTPPTYRSEVLLAPVQSQDPSGLASIVGQLGGLASLAGISLSGGDQTAEAIAVLRSRSLTEQFIRDRDLLPVLFPKNWDAEKGQWRNPEKQPSMGDALLLFDEQIRSVRPDLQSGLVTLRIEWRDRNQAAEWANELAGRANQLLRARAMEEAERSLNYLSKALEQANNVELRSAISQLMESQLQSRTFASVRSDYAFRIVDPAAPSDLDKRVKPRRTLIVLAGAFGGFILGIVLVSFLEWLSTVRKASTAST